MAKTHKNAVATLARSPTHLLHCALQLAVDIFGQEVGALLTQRQYAVLAAVSANEGLTQSELVRATGIDRSTLADMIARMIENGYLARQRSSVDARAKTVRLTEMGRESLSAAGPKVADADARILGHLTAGKRDAFVGALLALSKAGEAALVGDTVEIRKKKKLDRAEKAPKSPKLGKGGKKKKKKAKKDKAAELASA